MADPQGLIAPHPPFRSSALLAEGGAWLSLIALILLIAGLLAWGGLFAYQRLLAGRAGEWREQVLTLEGELKPELLDQLVALSATIAGVGELLDGHPYPSNVFSFLDEVTQPDVSFSSLQFTAAPRKIELVGQARSYGAVASELARLEGHPQVEGLSFGGLARGEKGLVNFKIAITIKPSLLRLRPEERAERSPTGLSRP